MNSTFVTSSLTLISNSSTINIESWFIPFGILNIICLILVVILALIFLFIIAIDKTCHTVPMMLVANSCLAALICASDILWISVHTLQNDVKQIPYEDVFCIFRGYMTYVLCAVLNYSFLLQAFYRYVTVVYPTHLFWRSRQNQLFFIGLTWAYALIFPVAFMFNGEIIYNVDNQICQLPLHLSFSLIFVPLCVYGIPMQLIILIYLKLIRYVKNMSERMTSVNVVSRAQRELKMVRRTVIIVMILITIGFPYALFILMSFFTPPPKYHFRIAYIFVDISLVCVMIVLFQFTEPLKTSIMKKLKRRPNIVIPAMT